MSSDETPNAPATRDRREVVRAKAQHVQAQQSKALAVRRVSLAIVIVAVVAAAAVVVTWVVASAASRPMLSPSNMSGDGIRVSTVDVVEGSIDTGGGTLPDPTTAATPEPTPEATAATAEPTEEPSEAAIVDIRVYVDYLSPSSSQFQVANAPQLAEWVDQGAATLTYYPVALLTPKSNGTKYSLRAAGASACVATHSPDTFFVYNHALLSRQPQIDSDGYSDAELADIAQASGADQPKRVRACIEGEEFTGWVQDATERALAGALPDTDGVMLTGPIVLVNGVPYVGALDDPMEFAQFVLTLSSDAYYKATPEETPEPTPTDSASPSPSK